MALYLILIICFALIAALIFLISYICFRIVFYASRKKAKENEYDFPPGKAYEPYYDIMRGWIDEVRALPCTDMYITSFDGLKLHGRFYEYQKGAPIELMFHGYRGSADRDLCGGVQRCFCLGRSVLMVDQRAAGKSEGNIISFGINESRDCLLWIEHLINTFGKDIKIVLCGISMGAATVLMAAGNNLPENVKGVLADCGYTSAEEMIKKTIRELKLPEKLLYLFVRLGARVYGGFNIKEASPVSVMKNCKVPIMFIHGENDNFVPCEMSRQNFLACQSAKQILTVKDADHGLSYIVDPKAYLTAMAEFFTKNNLPTDIKN